MPSSRPRNLTATEKERAKALGKCRFEAVVKIETTFAPFKRHSTREQLEMMENLEGVILKYKKDPLYALPDVQQEEMRLNEMCSKSPQTPEE